MRSRVAGLLLLAAPAGVAAAQPPAPSSRASCIDSIPASALRRAPVYTIAEVGDSLAPERRPLLESIDRFTLGVATTMRDFLHAVPGEWTVGEPLLTWRTSGGKVRVTVFRDGRFTRRAADAPAGVDARFGTGGADLLLRALDTLDVSGRRFDWPSAQPGDSASFALALERSMISREGEILPLTARVAFPTMTVNAPWSSPVRLVREAVPRYPPAARQSSVEGRVLLQFVVDADGRVEMDSVRDMVDAMEIGPWGRRYYAAFVESAREALGQMRYAPALVGGCAVRQLVEQAFTFALSP